MSGCKWVTHEGCLREWNEILTPLEKQDLFIRPIQTASPVQVLTDVWENSCWKTEQEQNKWKTCLQSKAVEKKVSNKSSRQIHLQINKVGAVAVYSCDAKCNSWVINWLAAALTNI